jgi:hypothetical protein
MKHFPRAAVRFYSDYKEGTKARKALAYAEERLKNT